MDIKITPTAPNEINFTLSITMSLGQWKKLREELVSVPFPKSFMNCRLSDAIYGLIGKAEQQFEDSKEAR